MKSHYPSRKWAKIKISVFAIFHFNATNSNYEGAHNWLKYRDRGSEEWEFFSLPFDARITLESSICSFFFRTAKCSFYYNFITHISRFQIFFLKTFSCSLFTYFFHFSHSTEEKISFTECEKWLSYGANLAFPTASLETSMNSEIGFVRSCYS